ncbi:MAG: type 4a pilus biogenesis protein PilO [Chitinispirillaceae bacterium]|nr:type 4a pilus biogenesis protein PilO [Chitinispirillaceae bacterium]
MTLATVRSYRLLTWLVPVFMVVLAQDLLTSGIKKAGARIVSMHSYSQKIRNTGVHIRELPEMKGDLERLAHKKMEIASSLLGARSEADLYELLMLKARETEAVIMTVAPRQPRPGEGFSEFPLTVEAAGPFNNLARFIAAVENLNRIMRVEELVMMKNRDGVLIASIQLLVYRYSDAMPTPAQRASKKWQAESAFEKRDQYIADLEKALAVTIEIPANTFAFSGQGDPFGAFTTAQVKARTKTASPPTKPLDLILKGILWKDPPLAILEALDGRTFIVKRGDAVKGMKVSSISRTDITIAAPQGTYVLHQYDQK